MVQTDSMSHEGVCVCHESLELMLRHDSYVVMHDAANRMHFAMLCL